jgi:hypothetical protein
MTDQPPVHLSDDTLYEYLDEALAPAELAQAGAHLVGCGECAGRLAQLRALFAGLEALPDAALSRDLSPAITHALRRPRPTVVMPRHPLYRLIFPAQAFVAIVLLAFAWPLVADRVSGLASPAATLLNNLLPSLPTLADLSDRAAQPLPDLLDGFRIAWLGLRSSSVLAVPLNALLAVAAITGLLWVATSLWLVQHPQRGPIRRTP